MKRCLVLLCGISIFLLLAGGGALFYGRYLSRIDGPLTAPRVYDVEKGIGSRAIAESLESRGVIGNRWIFLAALKIRGQEATIKAGEYEFPARVSTEKLLDQLIAGRIVERKVTIPEGWTSYEIIEELKKTEGLSGEITAVPTEGALLPDTYHFTKNETRAAKVMQMADAMSKLRAEIWESRAADLPFSTWDEAVTLASIVEKETGKAAERPRIARVFINRLRAGMPLQSDPTVIYALTNGRPENKGQGPLGRRLLSRDLEIDSPYNTYKNTGLPPAPIANPGRAAIEAVLHPAQGDDLYFVADGTGGHVFAATLDAHNANVAKWRAMRNAAE